MIEREQAWQDREFLRQYEPEVTDVDPYAEIMEYTEVYADEIKEYLHAGDYHKLEAFAIELDSTRRIIEGILSHIMRDVVARGEYEAAAEVIITTLKKLNTAYLTEVGRVFHCGRCAESCVDIDRATEYVHAWLSDEAMVGRFPEHPVALVANGLSTMNTHLVLEHLANE